MAVVILNGEQEEVGVVSQGAGQDRIFFCWSEMEQWKFTPVSPLLASILFYCESQAIMWPNQKIKVAKKNNSQLN